MITYSFTRIDGSTFKADHSDHLIKHLWDQDIDTVVAINIVHHSILNFVKKLEVGRKRSTFECQFGKVVIELNQS